ncbi:MAG: hypothetical protein U0Q16_23980 [Bryobacteraceae bacterium]
MRQDLDKLGREMEQAMQRLGIVVFRGASRPDSAYKSAIFWDTINHEDHEGFLKAAVELGVRVMVFYTRAFESGMLDDAFDKLEAAAMPREESREYERGLRRIKEYEGFTAAVEMSFDYAGQLYVYEVLAPWFREYLDIAENIDDALESSMESGGHEPGPLGGYFSQN